ncbi:MAG: DnaA regulatory inactivator Hda [Tibeticola sp.]
MQQIALDIGLAVPQTLDRFVPGANAAALEHLQRWVGGARPPSVPTYFWGEPGSGKSHLLQAAAEALSQCGLRVGRLDATSVADQAFDEGWSAVLMDDVHLYTAAQQEQAFNWFVNALSPASGPPRGVLAAGRLPPADLRLREDLRSRLGWGEVYALQPPDESVCRAVLRGQAHARGLVLRDDVIDYVLARFPRDLGSLAALLDQLDDHALRTRRAITIPLIKDMLENA